MKLTEYGRQLLPRAQQAVQEVARFAEEALALKGNLSGTVAVGLPGSIAARIVAPVFQHARKQYPGLSIRFVEALSGGAEELLAVQRIGVALFFSGKPNKARGDVALAASKLHLVGQAGDILTGRGPVSLSRLAQRPLLLPSRPHAVRLMIEEAFAKAKLPLYVPCEIDSLIALREAVVAGIGYTVATYDSVATDVVAGRLQAVPIKNPQLMRVLVMSLGPKNTITASSRAVAASISKVASDLIRSGEWQPPRR